MMTIRRRLLSLLLPALALLMLIGGVIDYRVAILTTRNAYDQALANTAAAFAANMRIEDGQLRFMPAGAGGALDNAASKAATVGAAKEVPRTSA